MIVEDIEVRPTTPTVRLDRQTYYALAERGFFEGRRVMLIDGELIEMPPMKSPHAWALTVLSRWLMTTFDQRYLVRIQMPMNVGLTSDLEPDAAVILGQGGPTMDHPASASLVIEVSDSSLRLDRRKIEMYAEARVTEYWIVNIPERCVDVYRNPTGATFADTVTVKPGQSLSPLANPQSSLEVAILFK